MERLVVFIVSFLAMRDVSLLVCFFHGLLLLLEFIVPLRKDVRYSLEGVRF